MLLEVFESRFVLVGELQTLLAAATHLDSEQSAEQAFLDATIILLNDEAFRYLHLQFHWTLGIIKH